MKETDEQLVARMARIEAYMATTEFKRAVAKNVKIICESTKRYERALKRLAKR